ncbi:hypothetical protein [Vibrio parahaemolyticus]|nr:hypothetical protein [Vibrio parahaemolyticus]
MKKPIVAVLFAVATILYAGFDKYSDYREGKAIEKKLEVMYKR